MTYSIFEASQLMRNLSKSEKVQAATPHGPSCKKLQNASSPDIITSGILGLLAPATML